MANAALRLARGRAPGKVIVLGEHAAVYGRPAVAAAIDRWVDVALMQASYGRSEVVDDPRFAEAFARAARLVGTSCSEVSAQIASDLPQAMGLGSSAALSVALLRAFANFAGRDLPITELNAHALEVEAVFHGTPSGVDNSAVVFGGVIRFQRDTAVQPLPLAYSVPLVIALGTAPRQTKQVVAALRERWTADPNTYERRFDEIAWLVADAEGSLASGDFAELGLLMNTNHGLLHSLGVSSDELESMVTLARSHGALGAKLTGGGGGGAIICLCPDPRESLIRAFADAGWQAFSTDITDGGRGVDGRNAAARHERGVATRA
ncbi:MAG TPA: mevalonate kinase [Candidatus Binatia bacterium]|nr:mevalonate kinase [Candidatus Binatia bacterium]